MPTVPRLEIPTGAGISAGSGVFSNADRAATPDAFGASVGQAEQGFGKAVDHASDVMEKQANYLQDRANQAAATDMFVNWDKEASAVTTWYKSQSGKNAVDALPEYYKKLDEVREKRRMGYMISDGGSYAGNQNKQYNLTQARARQDLSIQQAGNAKDDGEFNNALTDAKIGAANEAEELGLPPDQKKLHLDNAVSKAWGTRLQTIAMTDPFRAKELYDKNKESITNPETRLAIEHNLQNQYNSVGTRVVSHAIENGAPIPNLPPSVGTNREAIGKIESGGNYDAQGPVVQSGRFAGQRAVGKYQVMEGNIGPWTKEVLGKELTPEEFRKDKEAQDAVFDAKFGQLVEKYGSVQDAASAWHSGRPLAQAVAEGAKDQNLSTADYVKRFTAALGQNPAEPLTPDSGPEWERNAIARAKEASQKLAPDNPQFEDLLINRVRNKYTLMRTGTERIYRENYNTVKGALLENNPDGRPTITTEDQILDNPQLNAAYVALDKVHKNAVIAQVNKNARADVPMDDNRLKRYNELKGQASLDPAKFRDTDIMAEDLPRSSKKELLGLQTAAEKRAQDTTGLTRALSSVTPMLNDAGIRRSATDQQVASRYNQFVGAFQTERDQWIKDKGGKVPTDKENQIIAAGVLRVAQPAGWFFGAERLGFEVPDDSKTEIGKAFSTRYGRPPTPAETYQIYQRQLKRESNASK
jgi:hypothetical protein